MILQIFLQIPDSLQGDTQYKIGYYIGAWLPFTVLLLITILVVWLIRRRR
jgi:hypothetical protein